MSAESPLPILVSELPDSGIQLISYSSDTEAGKLATLQNEIAWQQLQAALTGGDFQLAARSIPTDPLLQDQWHLINTGQQVGAPNFQDIFAVPGEDINVAQAWNLGLTGEGVVVAVIDSGVEFTHPDLAANIDPNVQFDAITGDPDASPELLAIDPSGAHGTAVAGLIGAVANNGEGGTGVAPGVQLVPIRLIDLFGPTPFAIEDAFRFRTDLIDITNNSWGPPDTGTLSAPTALEVLALRDAVEFGRDGLGIIHVWASGNGAEGLRFDGTGFIGAPDSSSYDGYVNSRYTIGVTGVDHDGEYNNVDGTVTGYPEIGPSVLVAAPTGSVFLGVGNDIGTGSGLLTTDTTSDSGFNVDPDPDNGSQLDFDYLADEAYTSRFNGTSGATPIVSGVIALMLEANPNLSWRDVQDILVRSARQNAEFSTQADGLDKSVGIEYQNTWIINQQPLFHDPDPYDPLIDNDLQQKAPILDPSIFGPDNSVHFLPTPQVLTNGAGFTVSQGRGTNKDQVGYAHGVVDAELAVQLAQQWSTKGQHLPDELTYTTSITRDGLITLPRAEVVDDLIIPGGFDGEAGFGSYWQEYFDPVPDFSPDFPERSEPIDLTVPSPNDMVVETVEVNVIVSGSDTSDFVDNVRMVLVSPTGTHSEFNPYFVDPDPTVQDGDNIHQAFVANGISHIPGEINPLDGISVPVNAFDAGRTVPGGTFAFSFSTNRNWGERSDDALNIDPTTGEPVFGAGNRFNLVDSNAGDFLTQGWQLHFENYSSTPFTIDSIEVVWHGSPIIEGTRRVQGLIGIDDNRDDLFNYSRVIQSVVDLDGDPTTLRLGEVQNYVDPNHESMAANVTVLAFRDANGNGEIDATDQLVDQFVTGADGNYYFDLVPDDYIIALDSDSLGTLTPLDDSLSPAGILKDYQAQWVVNSEFFQVWDYDANLDVPIDPVTNAPVPLADASGNFVEYNVNHINFLLDPGAPVAPEVVFSGQVFADVNGDGLFNANVNDTDTVAPGIFVFGDTNQNNQFDSGEEFTTTDSNGNYTLVVPSTSIANINVGVTAPVGWSFTNPTSGLLSFFTEPGDALSNVDFGLQPSSGPGVEGSSQPGTIIGSVFSDDNEDGIRQTSELGIPGIEVYIDNNDSGVNDAGDLVVTTNSSGAFIFGAAPVGIHKLRIDLSGNPTLEQTTPLVNSPIIVNVAGESTISGLTFGVANAADFDFGDLPAIYGVTTSNDLAGGARHTKGIFFLGASVDAEIDGVHSADALGDDVNGLSDEDGILVDPLAPGVTGQLEAIASRHGGFLQGWVDFNGDGDFNDIIGGVSERVFTNTLLNPGSNFLNFAVPDVIDADTVYARFRYGEFGLGLTGFAQVGEVEDYVIPKLVVAPIHGPDFNSDGDVDGSDFLALQRGLGIQTNALPGNGDANNDGAVGMDDFAMWLNGFTGGTAALAAGQSSGGGGPDAPLAAAIAPQLQSSIAETTINEAFYGDGQTSIVTRGPRLVQPGFPEELPSSVVDTGEVDTIRSQNELAAVAGRVQTQSSRGVAREDSARPEQRVAAVRSSYRVDSAVDARDEAFAERLERSKRAASLEEQDQDTEDEALAVALGEEIDWLLN